MAELTATFRRPFAQQVAAFRLRLGDLVPTSRWDDIQRDAHNRAFMVAGATKADLLADLAGAVDQAIAGGTTLEEFRRDFRQIVERHGWHGWTGEGTKKGEAWRTRVIYKTNIATTYAAGRHAQLVEGGFRWWVYRHGGSLEPRPHHLSWDGVALPPDHPFWAMHYPPNGWGCSCRVFGARTRAGIRRVGGDPDKRLPDNWQTIDPKTGAPIGIDRGWDYAPGASVSETVSALAGKLDRLPEKPSVGLIQDWLRSDAFADWFAAPSGTFPLARISDTHAAQIGAEVRVAHMSAETAAKQLREHPELLTREYVQAQNVVDRATTVVRDGAQSLVFIHEPPDANGLVLVVRATVSGKGLFVTSFRRLSADQARRDRELRRILRREV